MILIRSNYNKFFFYNSKSLDIYSNHPIPNSSLSMTSTQQSLKTQLFSNLSKQGFHDDIKKQLRAKLIEQLKEKNLLQTKNQQKQLFKRVITSLIMEQLQVNSHPFTQSVYSIESGFENAHMTRNELIELMTFRHEEINENESLLQYILRRKQPFSMNTLHNIEIQTNPEELVHTLQQKLMMIDQQYRMNLMHKENLTKNNLFDRKKLQSELAERYKKEMDLFKEFQTHKIKIKVSEQWRIKFQQYSTSIAQEYSRKYDLLRKKDKQLNEEYLQKYNHLHLKVNESEKTINQKLQLLQMKNTTIQAQTQNLQKSKFTSNQLLSKRQKQLNEKIREYDSLILNMKEKIKYEVNVVKLSLQQDFYDREAEGMRRKKVVDEEYGKLMGIKDSIDIVEKENVRLSEENQNLRNHLVQLEKQLKSTVLELANKVDRIETFKDDLTQVNEVKRSVQDKLKEELKKSKRYQSEIISMREQLDRLRAKENKMSIGNGNNTSQISQPSLIQIERTNESKRIDEVNRRMEKLKNERKKDIEKFKLEI